MKNKLLLIILFVFATFIESVAQYNFVVQNGTTSVYTTIDEAYNNASEGDTIYLPGGSFKMPNIDKSLTWIGVGYHPDSTLATYITRISNSVAILGNADSSSFTGIYFAGNVNLGSTNNDANYVTFFRCRVYGTMILKVRDNIERKIDTKLIECVVRGSLSANLGSHVTVSKCILSGLSDGFVHGIFDRVIFTTSARNSSWGYSYSFSSSHDCLIKNSILNYYYYANWVISRQNCYNNKFKNNIIAGNINFPDETNTGEKNLTGVDLTTVFEHIDAEGVAVFSYLHDYHMKEGSPGIKAGIDSTDVGIYGGDNPFKEGGLPANPHIRKVKIADETSNGLLSVEIEVSAQDK